MENTRANHAAFDLLIQGGTVVDPSQGIHGAMDVAVKDGKIAAVAEHIETPAAETVDATDKMVVPGLIDLHAHVYWGHNPLGVDPEALFVQNGATTIVDAGSTGGGNFKGFKAHIIDVSKARILAFLNIGFAGMFGFLGPGREKAFSVGNLCDIRLANISRAVQTAEEHPDVIVGIKITASIVDGCDWPGLDPVYIARRAAEELGKPLMVHIGTAPPTTEALLPLLRPGDILTHSFRGNPNSLLNGKGELLPELLDARQRGVVFDLGHGAGSFAFDTARRMLDAGFLPDVISSDVHAFSINGPAFDLPTTMSKMLNLGMDIDEVVRACT
jgi:dihydroorotase